MVKLKDVRTKSSPEGTRPSDDSVGRDCKLQQFLVLSFAGCETMEMATTDSKAIHMKMMTCYERHVKLWCISHQQFSPAQMMTVSKGKLWDGDNLWTRFKHVRSWCLNTAMPLWNSLTSNCEPPSGKTIEDILNEMLAELWATAEAERLAKTRKRGDQHTP